ncbi:NADP-dependent oxidoreductase [Streptomyces sp. NBC_00963]|uniref:NADP-dependent oxidoreductase n=1 Tax=Streptomyces sp. NBC_00963 TaxID=2903697 RepID=UPI00386F4D9D|nr:NADP-dependent oxidoreductase [Streptomyces sp. NBC_00963]
MKGREIHLTSRPLGWPSTDDFCMAEVAVADPQAGELLVRNQVMSVDPYMRGRMNEIPSYVAPFGIGRPLEGGAVGTVIESGSALFAPGDVVLHNAGWREYATVAEDATTKVDIDLAPPSAYLGVLGMPGLTAYAGILEVAALCPGEVVFVSAAAGAVGSAAGQIARLKGAARVVGSAGSPDKVAYLRDIGFDASFDYHDGALRRSLRTAAPDGVDIYFDNVGGRHLEVAIGAMRPHGRVAMCGAISMYNADEPPAAPRNLALAMGKRLTLRGFLAGDFAHLRERFVAEAAGWLHRGELQYRETFAEGLPAAPRAFLDMMRGRNLGKMLVRL